MFTKVAIAALLATATLQQGCDVQSPAAIAEQFQTKLQEYFTHAKAEAVPEKQAIVGLTCMSGAGPALQREIAQFLVNDPDLRKLSYLRMAAPLGVRSYKYVMICFDNGCVTYDVDVRRAAFVEPWNGYEEAYEQRCKLQDHSSSR